MNNRAWRHAQLNGVIQYNAALKGKPVRDNWNIQISKFLSFNTETIEDPDLPSLLNTVTMQSLIHVTNKANEVRIDYNY